MHRSRHLALHVDTEQELTAWRVRLKEHGVRVTPPLAHELLESLYFDDPNGIQLEITRPLRAFAEVDARDAELTLRALSDIAKRRAPHRRGHVAPQGRTRPRPRRAGRPGRGEGEHPMTTLYVLDIPEFDDLVRVARDTGYGIRSRGRLRRGDRGRPPGARQGRGRRPPRDLVRRAHRRLQRPSRPSRRGRTPPGRGRPLPQS